MGLSDSFVILWLVVAGICIVPGLILTLVNQNRQKRPPALQLLKRVPSTPKRSVSFVSPCPASRTCFACGQRTDDDEAHFCWYCGTPLASAPVKSRKLAATSTILVDERMLEQEIQRRRHAQRREVSCPYVHREQ
ncbi:MAG TPA: hypothetical protein VFV38_07175 [Ktedonobacteraceae bacterium]|nr:hypothetical protein [Ktedonobacteraceae bacterium]